MKRKISKLMTFVMALAMMLMMSVPSFAGVSGGSDSTAGPSTGVTLDKYVVIDANANVPAGEFTFNVTVPNSDIAATSDNLAVKAGLSPGSVVVGGTGNKVSVDANASKNSENAQKALGDSNTDKKAAVVTFTLNFENVTFTAPGVYRYYITEQTPASPFSIYNRTSSSSNSAESETLTESATTTVDLYIGYNDTTGSLEYQGFVAYNGQITAAPKANATAANSKPDGVTKDGKHVNTVATNSLIVQKIVAGNQGDKTNDQFTFTITITDAGNGTTIIADSGSTATDISPATITTGSSGDDAGKAVVTAKFKHNQVLTLTGIPAAAKVTVTENTATGTTERKTSDGYIVTGEVQTATLISDLADNTITITNTKNGAVPTGVLTKMVPGIVLIAIAALLLARRKLTGNK